MTDCRFKPIEKWPSKPTPEYMRLHSRFKAGWQAKLNPMEREQNHLKAKDINILSFAVNQGTTVMPCDKHTD